MSATYDEGAIGRLLRAQSGVVARRQLLAAGALPHDVARHVRRRELTRVHPGVYVDHTGPPSWRQRAWAACLYFWPAALAGISALGTESTVIEIAVDESRRCGPLAGVRVRRSSGFDELVVWNASPPKMRIEVAAIDVAVSMGDRLAQVGLLADLCRSGQTTAIRLLDALDSRPRARDRAWLADVLTDVASGTCSTLEHGYLAKVERPHGLPPAARQRPGTSALGPVRRDVDYSPLPLVVELDGRLFHDTPTQRDRDLDRDLDLVVAGRRTVRLGWGQVYRRPCRTAARIATLLTAVGWHGSPVRCGPSCTLSLQTGDSDLPGEPEPPL